MQQRTIKKSVEVVGIGLHKGEPIHFSLSPLDTNSGIVFYRSDTNTYIEAKPANVIDTQMATVIGQEGESISTIEHLLSATYAYGIARNHPFADGNKRTSLVVAELFLMLNGHALTASNAECVTTFLDLAAGALTEADLAQWFRDHMEPLAD